MYTYKTLIYTLSIYYYIKICVFLCLEQEAKQLEEGVCHRNAECHSGSRQTMNR